MDPQAVEQAVSAEGCGGIVTFLGVVRDRSDDGRPVSGLSYEAYDDLALAEFEAIGNEARQRFGDVRLAIVHRTGEVNAGEIAVAVSAAAAHRASAFDACRYAIDEVKRRAPIWKKERFSDGSQRWTENRA